MSLLRSAVPEEIEIDGRRCRWSRLTLADSGELERRFVASRPDPMACAREHLVGLSEGLQRRLLELGFAAGLEPPAPTVGWVRPWVPGGRGLECALELAVRRGTPSVGVESCRRAVYESLGGGERGPRGVELLRVVAEATGIALADGIASGNVSGRSAVVAASAVCNEPERHHDDDQEPEWIGALYGTD